MNKANIKIEGTLPIQIIAQEDGYVGVCPTLNLVSQGKTREEALEMINECLVIFFEDLVENDNLDVLLEYGWKIEIQQTDSPIKIIIPPSVVTESVQLNEIFSI